MNTEQFELSRRMKLAACNSLRGKEQLDIALQWLDFKGNDSLLFGKLTVLHYEMYGDDNRNILQAGAAVELLLLALDIFDDLQDRDQPSAPWMQAGEDKTINVAIGLLAISIKLLAETPFDPAAVTLASKYMGEQVCHAVNGQYLDISNRIASEEEYIEMVRQKSGSLVAMACLIGASLAGGADAAVITKYASHIGIAAQIKNDIRDVCRWDEKNDLFNKRRTLPILFALERTEPEAEWIRDYYEGRRSIDCIYEHKQRIHSYFVRCGAIEYATTVMNVHQLLAMEHIDQLQSDETWKRKLKGCIH